MTQGNNGNGLSQSFLSCIPPPLMQKFDNLSPKISKRRASALTAVTLPVLLAERARELYLEGHRRTDMVRFGVFNAPVIERPVKSDGYKCVYPIPTNSLASNPNLKQNFGY